MTLKSTKDMMEKIKLSDTIVIEEIKNSMPTATMQTKGLMDAQDRKRSYSWSSQAGVGKVLHVGRFPRGGSVSFSAISGNNSGSVTSIPTPIIIAINNHSTTGIRTTQIGSGNKWAYIDDGEYINLYYLCSAYVGDGIFIISYSSVELIMEFVNTPSDLVLI